MTHKNILILGGGPTALATAVKLVEAGKSVKILERLPWVGGLSKSFQRGPYMLDLGPHRFTPHSKEVYEFGRDMAKGELAEVEYKAEILIANRWLGYPFKIGQLLSRIPPLLAIKLVSTFALSTLRPENKDDKTYESWITRHFGPVVTRLVFRPLVEKVWGTPLKELSARFARQRIAIASLFEIVWEVLSGKRAAKFHSDFYPDNGFLYPTKGFGVMTDSMEDIIRKKGGVIETDSTVKKIRVSGGEITEVVYEKGGVEKVEKPDFVMSTIPIQYFFQILEPRPSDAIMQAASELKTRRLILLYLVLKMDYYSENTSVYFPSQEFPFGRMWEQKRHSRHTVDVPGRTVLGIEMPCWEEDPLWKADDKTVFEKAMAPMEKYGFLKRSDVEEYFTVKLGSVYPVWDVNFEKNLGILLGYEKQIENLLLNGRPGLFFYNNFHHSLDMGFVAANHILSGKLKSEKWDLDTKQFEEFRLVE